MGTGGRSSLQNTRGRPLLAGLPHRRYSVPETIMRKYTLTKQNSESNSDSGAKTVPALTPPSMSMSPKKLSNASDRDWQTNGGGKTPPGDRRRKTGRRMFDDGFKKPTRGTFKVRRGPPMYRGNHGNLDPISDSAESDFITQDDVKASLGDKTSGTSSSSEIKSPDCAECKAFLRDVVAEEVETSSKKSPQRLPASDVNEKVIQESAIEVPLDDNTQEIEEEPAKPDSTISEGSNILNEKSETTSPKFVIPRIKPVLSKTPAFKSVSAANSEDADNAIQTPPNSERSKSTSIEQVSDLSTPSPYEYQSSADSGAANHNYSTLTPDTDASTSEKTSGYSELSSLENSSPAGNTDTSPEQDRVPRLNLGPMSSSVTPASSSTPNEGSGNGSGSSPSPREPQSDRSSTQDSTLSLLSESTPRSKAFSMLSSVSTPVFTTPVLTIATESKQTQYDPEDAQCESIATNTDSPVPMESTSTNTERFQEVDSSARQQDDAKSDEKQAGGSDAEKLEGEFMTVNPLEHSEMEAVEKSEVEEEMFTENSVAGDLEGVVNDVNPMTYLDVGPRPNVDDNIEEINDDAVSDKERDSMSPSIRSDSLNSLDGDKAPRANDDSPRATNKFSDTMSSQPSLITRNFSMSRSTEEKYAKDTQPPPSQSSDVSSRELMFSPESQTALDRDIYSFANRFDEDEYIKLTHQRQRFWMNRKPSEITLPSTPSHGALSCIGAGTIYRRNNFDVQLVVPRYSALPRSISMLVNTSSADCSSNSSDSECLSLVDSLDEAVSKSPSRFRTEDVISLLLDESVVAKQGVNVATPRGKAKAFFVPMDELISTTDQVPVVAAAMPDKLKEKLFRRQKVIDMKRQQKAESQEIKEKELKAKMAKIAKEKKSSKVKVDKDDKKSPRDKAKKVKSPRKGEKGDGDMVSPRSTTKDDAPTSSRENFAKPKKKASDNQESESDKPSVDTQDINKPMLPTKPSQKSSIPVKKGSDLPLTSPRGGPPARPSQLPIRRRHVSPPIRRSANLLGRFQQRFEVIPEEKSGSMESSEETGRHSMNKLPVKDKEGSGKEVSPTSTFTRAKREAEPKAHKRIPRPTRTLRPSKVSQGPVIENIVIREIEDDSKDSYQGKAALAPHTDEGMSALSKGWINFYMLQGMSSPENHSDEALLTLSDKERQRRSSQNSAPLKTVNVVGGNGNRIRTYTVPYHEPRTMPSIPTLPEIKSGTSSRKQSLKSAERPATTSPDGSKITAVLHLPSPRLPPPYLFDGSEEQMTSETSSVTSSDSESDMTASPALLPVRWPIRQQQRRLPPHRSKSQHSRDHAQNPRQSSANVGVGWTVTVASSNSQHTPDLEMRLSFPSSTKRQPNSQSDSGLGEDNNNNKGNGKETREERSRKQSHFLPPTSPVQQTQRWTLTVKNGGLERMQDNRAEKRLLQSLPELENQQGPRQLNTKKAIKVLKKRQLPIEYEW